MDLFFIFPIIFLFWMALKLCSLGKTTLTWSSMGADCIYDFPLHMFILAYYLGIIVLWLYKAFINVTNNILMVFHFFYGLAVDKDGRSLLDIFKNPGMHTFSTYTDLVDGKDVFIQQSPTWSIQGYISSQNCKWKDDRSSSALPRIPPKYLVLTDCINFDGSVFHLGRLDRDSQANSPHH